MPSELQQRIGEVEDLVLRNREKVGKRAGVPFILFTYPPEKELTADEEIRGFIDKLEFNGQMVEAIDLRSTVFEILEERQILDDVIEVERSDRDHLREGLKSSLIDSSSGMGALASRIATAAENDTTDVVVVYRMGILYPFASASTLMAQLEGGIPIDTPIVFCYPATVEDNTLRFLDEREGTYYRARVF